MGAEELTGKKCADCALCVLAGWWDLQRICELSGLPADEDAPACINIKPR